MLKTLLKEVKEYKLPAILTMVFGALEVLMETLIPFITASLIDEGITKANMSAIYKYGGIMIIMALLSLFFAVLAGRLAAKASTGFAANVRLAMYKRIQKFSFANIDKFSTGGLITRMTTDAQNLQQSFQMCTRMAVRAPLTLICSLVLCAITNRYMSLILIAAIVFLGIILGICVKRVVKIFTELFKKYDILNCDVQENISAIRVVKAYVREEEEIRKFGGAADMMYRIGVKAEKFMALLTPLMIFVIYALILIVSWVGAHFVVSNAMTTGELTSLFSYISSIMISLLMFMAVVVMLTMSLASAKRISEVLIEEPSIKDADDPVYEMKDGSIRFEHVDFSYGGENVLSDINIEIASGETIGITGATGAGKSSLAALISRLYDVSGGACVVGGVDVREYDKHTLRDKVAVVLQKNVLFSGTIYENLRWGNPDASEEDCKAACKTACADEFIELMPEGYNTKIEQGGSNVSGGQKQRLCIARALLKDPKVIILDDSTSAVDTATDARIRESFKAVIPDATKIIISQRLSSIMDADKIIVLDDGKVTGFDTHENLLRTNELYKEIYDIQQSSGGDFDEAKGAQ